MADGKLQLSIVTPEQNMVTDEVDQVNVPGTEGDMGILLDHAPLFSTLRPGELSYEKDGQTVSLVVSDGYVEVTANRVTVLAETAEYSGDIDRSRAEEAKRKAEAILAKGDLAEEELREAQKKLFRAIARLEHTSE
ncbi:MAG: F0F1 ATP synthase subunit epsilon [Nitrospina sp.]|nr:F0F1 ATP synthase subunit epsilon [Paracoccaceae bacterium]MCA9485134.1 F0F1 ATP synthase subunit epsilon [Nitrospina sp.]